MSTCEALSRFFSLEVKKKIPPSPFSSTISAQACVDKKPRTHTHTHTHAYTTPCQSSFFSPKALVLDRNVKVGVFGQSAYAEIGAAIAEMSDILPGLQILSVVKTKKKYLSKVNV